MAETFEEFVGARLPALLRLAGVLAGDRGIAEDVVQEVLLRASRRWSTIAAASSPDAYVRRMVVNEYVSWRRKWARIVPRAELIDERSVPDHADRHAEHDDLSRRLDRLPARQTWVAVTCRAHTKRKKLPMHLLPVTSQGQLLTLTTSCQHTPLHTRSQGPGG